MCREERLCGCVLPSVFFSTDLVTLTEIFLSLLCVTALWVLLLNMDYCITELRFPCQSKCNHVLVSLCVKWATGAAICDILRFLFCVSSFPSAVLKKGI